MPRGRPKGANSFTHIKMAELQKICGSDSTVPVSRVWLEKLGLELQEEKTSVVVSKPVENEETEEKIQFTINR